MVGIYDCYSCMSICHLKEFFFSSLKESDFLKGCFSFFFQCSLHEKFSIVEIKKGQLSVIVKELYDGRVQELGSMSSWQFEEYDVKEK